MADKKKPPSPDPPKQGKARKILNGIGGAVKVAGAITGKFKPKLGGALEILGEGIENSTKGKQQ